MVRAVAASTTASVTKQILLRVWQPVCQDVTATHWQVILAWHPDRKQFSGKGGSHGRATPAVSVHESVTDNNFYCSGILLVITMKKGAQ